MFSRYVTLAAYSSCCTTVHHHVAYKILENEVPSLQNIAIKTKYQSHNYNLYTKSFSCILSIKHEFIKIIKDHEELCVFLVIAGPVQQNQIIKPSVSIDNTEQK